MSEEIHVGILQRSNKQIRLTHAWVSRDLNWVQQQPQQVRSY